MQAAFPRPTSLRSCTIAAVFLLSCLRFAHIHLLWADEDYHLAAALQILHGKVPYRDFWYDKPPLSAIYYLLIGAYPGWPLRILDAAYVWLACWLVFRCARAWWGEAEGYLAALLLAFFTTFYLASAVIPFAPDALMLAPHLAAIYSASRKLPLWAGIWSGVAFLVNVKGVFVLLVCAVWLWPAIPLLAAGFAIPVGGGLLWAITSGAGPSYVEQVWRWGFRYAGGSPLPHPFETGIRETAHWLGFHAALLIAAVLGFRASTRAHRIKLAVWLLVSFAAVCVGSRFASRYFLQLLPVMVALAAHGTVIAFRANRKLAAAVLTVALLVPFVRFAPPYVFLTYDNLLGRASGWSDIQLNLDSQAVAAHIRALAHPGDTLFVWGYRPDVYVYTRMVAPGRFWDSQPLTGVPADRHLHATTLIYNGPVTANRAELVTTRPTFVIDGLSLLNPRLTPVVYPRLSSWLENYQLVARTRGYLVYRIRGQ